MRKILLGTTAVVGLALVAPEAFAQQARRPAARPAAAAPAPAPVAAPAPAPVTEVPSLIGQGAHGAGGSPAIATSGLSVRLGGFFDFSYGNVTDDIDRGAVRGGGAQGRQRSDFRTESEINLYVDGTAANGLRYGAVFELQMDNSQTGASDQTAVSYDELYGFMKGSWGELRFGQEDSAASLMQVRRPTVLWMNESDSWDEFAVSANYTLAGIGDGNDATKIIYLSPQFSGFDVGLSFAPNRFEGERSDTTGTNQQRDFTGMTNEISAALRYRGTMGAVGVQASIAAQFADSPRQSASGAPIASRDQNMTTYSAGLLLAAYGFQVGGDYTWGNYRTTPANGTIAAGLDGSTQLVLGVNYTTGALTVGGIYGSGTQDNGASVADRTTTYYGLGVAYVLAPGMTLFANYNKVKDENVPTAAPTRNGATRTNYGASGTTDYTRDITVLAAGVRVAF